MKTGLKKGMTAAQANTTAGKVAKEKIVALREQRYAHAYKKEYAHQKRQGNIFVSTVYYNVQIYVTCENCF